MLIGNPELIIVDEPIAGLDPEERNRFLNLLAKIGENVVVILSTHIVEDVADLCPQMAVLAGGRIQLEGAPLELIEKTRGRIWTKTIDRADLESCRPRYQLISTRLFAGRTVIHVLAEADPGDGFVAVQVSNRVEIDPSATRAEAKGAPGVRDNSRLSPTTGMAASMPTGQKLPNDLSAHHIHVGRANPVRCRAPSCPGSDSVPPTARSRALVCPLTISAERISPRTTVQCFAASAR